MTTTEWLPEPTSVSLPSIVSSTDLFDGDLFGDELIDIYNAAVDEGTSTVPAGEIPTLLPQPHDADAPKKPEEVHSDSYAGVAIGDGLGAFRPSTSFNDLTTLLPPATNPQTSVMADVVDNSEKDKSENVSCKRNVAESIAVDSPPLKKQKRIVSNVVAEECPSTVTSRLHKEVEPISTKNTNVATEGVADQQSSVDKNACDTPNPLSLKKTVEQPTSPFQSAPRMAAAATGTAPPVVVSPNTTTQVKEDVILPDVSTVVSAAAVVPVPTLSTTSSGSNATPNHTTTEADFKSVAQAAVSSLIMNAGANSKADAASENGKKVDTSTAHIKALTGNNWVAACSGASGCSVAAASSAADVKANNRARRQNLTPDERARQNRDRNREHARNTRLRKKAYVEELKRTLTELVAQRDAAEVEKRQSAQREVEQREVRFRVIEEFLKLRGRNEPNFARWAAILEEGFSLTLPITGFRKMVNIESEHEGVILEQVLTGVSEIMADSSNFASFLQTFGTGVEAMPVTFSYHCDRKNFFMDGSNAVLDWTASSIGAVKNGGRSELSLRGTIRAKFSPASNKLLSANITFDTGLVLSQLQNVIGPKHSSTSDHCDEIAAAAAAQVASSQADAILDSLQMPHLDSAVPAAVTVVPQVSSPASVTSSDKGENSSDESEGESSMQRA